MSPPSWPHLGFRVKPIDWQLITFSSDHSVQEVSVADCTVQHIMQDFKLELLGAWLMDSECDSILAYHYGPGFSCSDDKYEENTRE